jgi:hypothetical protein
MPPACLQKVRVDAPIIAWRVWRVAPAGFVAFLKSAFREDLWPASALFRSLVLPHAENTAGIYGLFTREEAVAALKLSSPERRGIFVGDPGVFGTVALGGKIIEHERGYRAAVAYPQHLYCANIKTAQVLARTYGCEAECA